jgi:hypothetical protein
MRLFICVLFIDAAIGAKYIASNIGRLITNALQKTWEEASITQTKERSLHLYEVTGKLYQDLQAGFPVTGIDFNPATHSKVVSFRGILKLIFWKVPTNTP